MTNAEALALKPGDNVTALTDGGYDDGTVIPGNVYVVVNVISFITQTALVHIYTGTCIPTVMSPDELELVATTFKMPANDQAPTPVHVIKVDESEPACRCSSPQVHDSGCQWITWKNKQRG